LKETPDDSFLRYALALEFRKEGSEEAAAMLARIIEDSPDYIAAWQQLGTWKSEDGFHEEAIGILKSGIQKARELGELKAASEMAEMLMMLDDDE
jgi:tetratricopeptide (TPR) repeat protein